MARSMWTGALSFGMVNIPVKMYTAIHEERVAFHLLHDQDKVRLKQKMVCPEDGTEVHREHMLRGFEISPEKYVVLREDEIEAAEPKSSRVIEIHDFVALDEIDPVFFDRPYYLVPAQHAEKSYALLAEAMEKTQKVGIAKFTMRNKEYLAALRPTDGVICLETMHFDEEVLRPKDVEDAPRDIKLEERELNMAQKLIEGLTTPFKPGQYHDDYRERLLAIIKKKSHGEEVTLKKEKPEKETRASDLMAALEASLAKARSKGASAPAEEVTAGGTKGRGGERAKGRKGAGDHGSGHRRKSA